MLPSSSSQPDGLVKKKRSNSDAENYGKRNIEQQEQIMKKENEVLMKLPNIINKIFLNQEEAIEKKIERVKEILSKVIKINIAPLFQITDKEAISTVTKGTLISKRIVSNIKNTKLIIDTINDNIKDLYMDNINNIKLHLESVGNELQTSIIPIIKSVKLFLLLSNNGASNNNNNNENEQQRNMCFEQLEQSVRTSMIYLKRLDKFSTGLSIDPNNLSMDNNKNKISPRLLSSPRLKRSKSKIFLLQQQQQQQQQQQEQNSLILPNSSPSSISNHHSDKVCFISNKPIYSFDNYIKVDDRYCLYDYFVCAGTGEKIGFREYIKDNEKYYLADYYKTFRNFICFGSGVSLLGKEYVEYNNNKYEKNWFIQNFPNVQLLS